MSKRARVLVYVFYGVSLVVILALAIPIFTHSAYYLVSEVLVFLLSGGLQISTGIIQIQRVKAQGVRISWWKQFYIMSGLGFVAFAIFLSSHLNSNWTNNMYVNIASFLVVLHSFGLIIYGFVLLLLQYPWTNNLSNRRGE
jgi:hypothetical protein